jgi:hypothetical protein
MQKESNHMTTTRVTPAVKQALGNVQANACAEPVTVATQQPSLFLSVNKSKSAPQGDEITATDLPSVIKHHDLDRVTIEKRVALHVARSLSLSADETQARRGAAALACADQVREDQHGNLKPVRRCEHPSCPICSHIKQRRIYARLRSALGYMPPMYDDAHESIPDRKRMRVLKVMLSTGQTCEINQLKDRLKLLHYEFGQFVNKRPEIKSEMLGFIRSTEIVQQPMCDGTLRANPHLHILLLTRGDSDLDALADFINREWRARLYRAQGGKVKTVNSSHTAELTCQTKEDLLSAASYMLKGGSYSYAKEPASLIAMLDTEPEFWQAFERATYRKKIVHQGGIVASALKQADEDYKRAQLATDRAGTLPHDFGSSLVRKSDFIYLRSVEGYARRSAIEYAHRVSMSLDQYMELPNVTGHRVCTELEFREELRCIAQGFSHHTQLTLTLLAINRDQSALNKARYNVNHKLTQETSSHWSEPNERTSRAPEDDPHWRPKTNSSPTPSKQAQGDQDS